jgi:hypothetical protein
VALADGMGVENLLIFQPVGLINLKRLGPIILSIYLNIKNKCM